MCATLLDPNQCAQCFAASPVRARERQNERLKRASLGESVGDPYPDRVTFNPYSGYIRSTNPIVRHVMSLKWALKRMRARQHALKRAVT